MHADLSGVYTEAMLRVTDAQRRDQFAMAALTGILSNVLFKGRQDIASEAYAHADAMLTARTPQEADK